ncbi:MAG: response regulator transcription factor [Actinomycetota bacterium]|nr:response regulator transcription factor [Actinomycetota bacterium]
MAERRTLVTDPVRILVVDDEVALADIVASYLRREGFEVTVAHDGRAAIDLVREKPPDVVLLDVMLPGIDGFEVCRQIRSHSDCYVLMLTARDHEVDKVVGLTVGADDYLVKPHSPRELGARIRAMLRRPRSDGQGSSVSAGSMPGGRAAGATTAREQTIRIGDLRVDLAARRVWVAEIEVQLTRTEFDLLALLAAAPRRAFTRRQLIESGWGSNWFGDEHVVDVHIGHLRRKLGDDAAEPRFIRTVRGIGYGMVDRS